MEYADYLKTDTMPPAITPSEEERKRMLIASAGGMSTMPPLPLARSAANATATMSPEFLDAARNAVTRQARPTSADTDRTRPERDEFFQGAVTSLKPQAGVATPAVAAQPQPSSLPSAAPTMPAVPLVSAPRSDASASPLTARPVMPPVRMLEAPAPPDLGAPKMPPVGLRIIPGSPARPAEIAGAEATPAPVQQTMPPLTLGPGEKREQELREQGRPGSPEGPKLSNWKKVLDTIGSLFPIGRAIETAIPGSPQNFDWELARATAAGEKERGEVKERQDIETRASQAQFNTPEKRLAYMQKNPDLFDDVSDFEKHDWVLSGKFPQKEPAPEKTTDKKIDEYTNDKGQRVLTFQRADNSTYDKVGGQTQPKPAGHTSAFEAFAYGTPEEKKAAQDYIDFEKKSAARYRTPSEFDEKFRLFKEDPDTYKAMFGDKDKSSAPDRATATKMLNYFDRRRREINQDFTLDDAQKQEQLKDIENLEKPFMDAVQPGAGGDRVKVIGPDGTPGTVPRSQLEKAKRKGYRVAQ